MSMMPSQRPSDVSLSARGVPPGPRGPAAVTSGPTVDPMRVIRQHLLAIVLSVLIGGALGAAAYWPLLKLSPTFTASAQFEVRPRQSAMDTFGASRGFDEDEIDRVRYAEVNELLGRRIATRLTESPRLQTAAPGFHSQYQTQGAFDYSKAAKDLDEKYIRALIVPNTNRFQFSVSYRSAEDSFQLASLLQSIYSDEKQRGYSQFLRAQIDALRSEVSKANQEIQALELQRETITREEGLGADSGRGLATQMQIQKTSDLASAVQQTLTDAQSQLTIYLEARDSATGPQFPDNLRQTVSASQQVVALEQRITDARTELKSLSKGFSPEHPAVTRVQRLIESLEDELEAKRNVLLAEALNGAIKSLQDAEVRERAKLEDLAAQLADLRAKANREAQALQRINTIESSIQRLVASTSELRSRVSDLESANQNFDIFTVAFPTRPELPTFPKLPVLVAAGLALGMASSLGFVFLREFTDQRIKAPADVRAIVGPGMMLGMLPDASVDPEAPANVQTAFLDAPGSVFAESVRQIRAPIMKRMDQAGHRSLLVTSPLPGSGATTIAINLACSIASIERRVLLIDTNFRRPAVHTVLGISEGPGLGDVLAGSFSLQDAVRKTEFPGLDVLTAGSTAAHRIEALSSDRMRSAVEQARQSYDIVVFDAAPAVVASDSRVIANLADATVLVARAMNEKRGLVTRLVAQFRECDAEVLGVVLNGVKSVAGGYLREDMRRAFRYLAPAATAAPSPRANA